MKLTTVLNQNRHLIATLLLTGTLTVVGSAEMVRTDAQTAPKALTQTVTRNAVWNPKGNTVQSIQQSCANQGAKFTACFVNGMQRAGASNQAIAFTRSIDNMGYFQAFRPVGKVSIAAVTVPFMANENQAIYLVNGNPGRINVDDYSLLQHNELKANPIYTQLVKKYTDVVMFPGDRTLTALKAERLANQQNIDRYRFRASAGQPINAYVNAPTGQVGLTLIDPNGNPIVRYQSGANSWSGKLPADGTYQLDVVNQSNASYYYLGLTIQP